MTPSTFIFVRHGESEGVHRILAGRTEGIPLTARGEVQVKGTARFLRQFGIKRIWSSPQLRTRQTTAIIAQALGLQSEIEEAFNEVHFGEWTGKSFCDLDNTPDWKTYNLFRSASHAPGGECIADAQYRALTKIIELHRLETGQVHLIVTHADVIRCVIAYFAGTPLDLFLRFRVDPASVSIVALTDYGAEIQLLNWRDFEDVQA